MEILEKINLFWDVDPQHIDIQAHKHFVLERILLRGDIDDLAWAKATYSEDDFKETIMRSRVLDPRSRNFWSNYFGIINESCTPKFSNQEPSAFLQR